MRQVTTTTTKPALDEKKAAADYKGQGPQAKRETLRVWLATSFFLLSGVSIVPEHAGAKDLGVVGKVYDIQEEDLRDVLARQLAQVDWKKEVNKKANELVESLDKLPTANLKRTKTSGTRFIDKTMVLKEDIVMEVPTGPGKVEKILMGKKGESVNPLDHVPFLESFLVIDGSDLDQVKFARDALNRNPLGMTVALAKGNPKNISEIMKRPVFYLMPQELGQFGVVELPTLIHGTAYKGKRMLGATSFGHPYKIQELEMVWKFDTSKVMARQDASQEKQKEQTKKINMMEKVIKNAPKN